MIRKLLLIFSLMLLTFASVWAQGVTTATISGRVLGAKSGSVGEALPGATVIAVHTPSGTKYGTTTNVDGHFTIANARVGGPYKVTVSFIGYQTQDKDNIFLSLGNVADVSFSLSEEGTQLQEVVVSAGKGDLFNSERTGAATNVDNRTINSIPNISRSLTDFTKLSPLANTAGGGTSFAGANNRYNQFAIDGLVNNDVFGLSSTGTNGGQTGINPISLDAIEEFQLNIAPYDIRQGGFTGGGINAITRSGTNTYSGSAYFFGNNQSLVGNHNPITEAKKPYGNYSDYQTGLRIGGPIIKDKLFFFVSGEIDRRSTPASYGVGNGSNIAQADLDAVTTTLKAIAPNYDPGTGGVLNLPLNSNKLLGKIDWNISDKHKLTIRHSYTYGQTILNGRSTNTLYLSNNGYQFPTTTNSSGLELNSTFKNNTSNRLLIGYTHVVDDRDPLGNPFPQTTVNLGSGKSIVFGSEGSSVANLLKQSIFSITDDFVFYRGKHTITLGTNNEFYKFYNLFVQYIYGRYSFGSLSDFQSQATATPVNPSFYGVGYSFDPNDDPSQSKGAADWSAMQLGVYGQDDIQYSEKFRLTYGLRIDMPIFPTKPGANDAYNNSSFGTEGKTGDVPKSNPLWSPRIGFNWDVNGDKDIQVRGGSGLFTGRVPFVWVSNQFTNNGIVNGAISVGNSAQGAAAGAVPYNIDPYSQTHNVGTVGRGDINVIDKNFKFPQVWRSNLAVDKRLPWGLVGTIETVFSKTLNNINYENLNRTATGRTFSGVDTRPIYTTASSDPTNKAYTTPSYNNTTYTNIDKLVNTNKGYSYNIVAQVQKQFENGFAGSVAYTYGDARDLNSGTSSVATSNWSFVNQVNGLNNLPLTRANFSTGSRIIAFVSYRKAYANNALATQLSVFYNGQSGQPFSYVYAGDMNYDGVSANDLIYIPKTQADINLHDIAGGATAADQWTALDKYISNDKYLSKHRGQYAERNGGRLPFQSEFDVRVLQDFAFKTGNTTHKFQLSVDILNFANMLDKGWGKQWTMSNQGFALINYGGMENAGTLPAYDYSANKPYFTYTGGGQTNGHPYVATDPYSRWRMQIGLRYIF